MTEEQKPPDNNAANSNVASLAAAALNKARKGKNKPPPADGDDKRPVIRIVSDRLPSILDQADQVLAELDKNLFDQAGRMVRISDGQRATAAKNGRRGEVDVTLLRDVTVPNLCDRLARVASWERFDARAGDWVKTDVPKRVAESLLARSGEWRHIPRLRGFVEAPTLRDDGTLMEVPGYDLASELFFNGSLVDGYSSPDESKEAAGDAIDTLAELLSSLPFVGKEDCAAAICGILTALVRRVLPAAPMIGITSPAAGTGKSLLTDVISIIATGHRAGVITLGKDEIEGDKRLSAALLGGDVVIALDNLERPLFGDLICQACSQPVIRIRQLGRGDLFPTPTNTLIVATANNLDIRGDLKRRVLLIRLDAKSERPETRRFEHDLLETATQRRGEMIRAALTIMRAYLACGSGVSLTPFGSFSHWSKWCREPLVWLGYPDPLDASGSLREQDPDLIAQRQAYLAWFRIFSHEEVGAGEVVHQSELAENNDLRSALDTVCSEKINARRLGFWLRRHKDRVCDGMRLEARGYTRTGVAVWRVKKL